MSGGLRPNGGGILSFRTNEDNVKNDKKLKKWKTNNYFWNPMRPNWSQSSSSRWCWQSALPSCTGSGWSRGWQRGTDPMRVGCGLRRQSQSWRSVKHFLWNKKKVEGKPTECSPDSLFWRVKAKIGCCVCTDSWAAPSLGFFHHIRLC